MKEPFEVIVLEKQIIKFYDETAYDIKTNDKVKDYSKIFISGEINQLTRLIGIELYEDEELISSCLIGSEGGKSALTDNTTLISYGGVVICCSNTVFKLNIPSLDLEWKTIADLITCFGIHYLGQDYVVHGEIEIIRIDKNGKIVWRNSGKDIWTTVDVIDNFAVYDDYILATDWDYNRYKFDYDGKLIDEYKIEPKK